MTESSQPIRAVQYRLGKCSGGIPQEKLVALRQCIGRIHINKPASQIKLDLCVIPSASLAGSVVILKGFDVS